MGRIVSVALVVVATCTGGMALAGDTFYILDNGKLPSQDGLYRSNTDDVSNDVLVRAYADYFWGDLSLSDQPRHLFAARMNEAPAIVKIREFDGAIVSEILTDIEIRSIGFDTASRVMYGINRDLQDSRLFTVDIETGATSLVGDTSIPGNVTALEYDSTRGTLYAANSHEDLYQIDPVSASAIRIGSLGLDDLFDIAWNPRDGRLYGTDEDTDSLYVIDRDTAIPTLVGGPYTNATYGTGMAFSNPVPEPAFSGDLNADGFVGQADLDIVLNAWGTSPPSDPRADTNDDNSVGQYDLDTVLNDWGLGVPPGAPVPDPATSVLLALGGMAVMQRRRRASHR